MSVLLLTFLAAGVANADNDFGVGLKAGTLGLGLEASWQPLPYIELRVGANSFGYSNDGGVAGIDYEQDLNLESYYGTVNFHFPISPMRVTAGYYSNGNELIMTNDLLDDQNIGGVVYPGAGIGTISSTTSFASGAGNCSRVSAWTTFRMGRVIPSQPSGWRSMGCTTWSISWGIQALRSSRITMKDWRGTGRSKPRLTLPSRRRKGR